MRRLIGVILCFCFLVIPVGAEEDTKYVALTFDDGPSGRFTCRLLAGLEERNVKATFFLCGYRMKEYRSLTEVICSAGHEIGLHGYSHDDMGKMTVSQLREELRKTKKWLPQGCEAVLLRPPGGKSSPAVKQVAKEEGLSLILWSVDPRDWENHDVSSVQAAVLETVRSGDVVLLHDMCDCSVDAALGIIDHLQAEGYRFVTVSELAKLRDADLRPGKEYKHFR